jgi:phosphotriesterase-related protein
MGCGYYTYDTHPLELKEWPCEKIRDEMLNDLLDGVGCSKIKAGIVGEIGTGREIHPDEFKVLKAAALASVVTNAAIQVHTYPWADTGTDAADFLIKNGANPEKIVICHSDVALRKDYILKILERGVFVQFDNFGKEFEPDISSSGFAGGRFAKDIERVKVIKYLMEKGFEKQLLITTDICLKCLLKKYGGKGYSHILENIIVMFQREEVPAKTIRDVLLIKNPARMLKQ